MLRGIKLDNTQEKYLQETLGFIPKLKMYTGYSIGGGSEMGACLVFAHNIKEAKKLAYNVISGWFDAGDHVWIDTGVRLIRNSLFLYKQANLEKLKNGIPHVNDSPESCKQCYLWGRLLNDKGYCASCSTNR